MTQQLSMTPLQRLSAGFARLFVRDRDWFAEDRSLRALAEIAEDELSSLSEIGQRMRRQFLRRRCR